MRRDLLRRIQRLEAGFRSNEPWPSLVVVVRSIESEQRNQLTAGERIVQDWFRNDNHLVLARERVTTEADDMGRRCGANSYLAEVIRELHNTCEYKERSCSICQGLDCIGDRGGVAGQQ